LDKTCGELRCDINKSLKEIRKEINLLMGLPRNADFKPPSRDEEMIQFRPNGDGPVPGYARPLMTDEDGDDSHEFFVQDLVTGELVAQTPTSLEEPKAAEEPAPAAAPAVEEAQPAEEAALAPEEAKPAEEAPPAPQEAEEEDAEALREVEEEVASLVRVMAETPQNSAEEVSELFGGVEAGDTGSFFGAAAPPSAMSLQSQQSPFQAASPAAAEAEEEAPAKAAAEKKADEAVKKYLVSKAAEEKVAEEKAALEVAAKNLASKAARKAAAEVAAKKRAEEKAAAEAAAKVTRYSGESFLRTRRIKKATRVLKENEPSITLTPMSDLDVPGIIWAAASARESKQPQEVQSSTTSLLKRGRVGWFGCAEDGSSEVTGTGASSSAEEGFVFARRSLWTPVSSFNMLDIAGIKEADAAWKETARTKQPSKRQQANAAGRRTAARLLELFGDAQKPRATDVQKVEEDSSCTPKPKRSARKASQLSDDSPDKDPQMTPKRRRITRKSSELSDDSPDKASARAAELLAEELIGAVGTKDRDSCAAGLK